MFSGFKQPICKFVVDAIDKIQSQNPTGKVSLDIVLEVASVFEFKDVHSFLKVHFAKSARLFPYVTFIYVTKFSQNQSVTPQN